ncbi:MAG: DinB family protein [Halopseudomonas sp.]|uniref:DinB family protein n=1 Tax=Halopseudomonas sp. TaxID=2901191 RepID=UPI003001DE27
MYRDQFMTLARYNQWMNQRLYALCAQLPEEDYRADRGAFFRSIHGTLNHLLLADRIWFGRFTGCPVSVTGLDAEQYTAFVPLREAREQLDQQIVAWVATLDALRLGGEFSYTSLVNPEPRRYPMWLVLTHFFNHQTHHRGQITTLLSQCGTDPGLTDLIHMPGVASATPIWQEDP